MFGKLLSAFLGIKPTENIQRVSQMGELTIPLEHSAQLRRSILESGAVIKDGLEVAERIKAAEKRAVKLFHNSKPHPRK